MELQTLVLHVTSLFFSALVTSAQLKHSSHIGHCIPGKTHATERGQRRESMIRSLRKYHLYRKN